MKSESRYEAMRDPLECTTDIMDRMYRRWKQKAKTIPPRKNRCVSNLGNVAFCRAFFSSDFITWFVRRYDADKRVFRTNDASLAFQLYGNPLENK